VSGVSWKLHPRLENIVPLATEDHVCTNTVYAYTRSISKQNGDIINGRIYGDSGTASAERNTSYFLQKDICDSYLCSSVGYSPKQTKYRSESRCVYDTQVQRKLEIAETKARRNKRKAQENVPKCGYIFVCQTTCKHTSFTDTDQGRCW
jgi:hypothetical protein